MAKSVAKNKKLNGSDADNVIGSIDNSIKKISKKKNISDEELKTILIKKNTKMLYSAMGLLEEMLKGNGKIAEMYGGLDGMKVAIDGIKNAAQIVETMYPRSTDDEEDVLPVHFSESMSKAKALMEAMKNVSEAEKLHVAKSKAKPLL